MILIKCKNYPYYRWYVSKIIPGFTYLGSEWVIYRKQSGLDGIRMPRVNSIWDCLNDIP